MVTLVNKSSSDHYLPTASIRTTLIWERLTSARHYSFSPGQRATNDPERHIGSAVTSVLSSVQRLEFPKISSSTTKIRSGRRPSADARRHKQFAAVRHFYQLADKHLRTAPAGGVAAGANPAARGGIRDNWALGAEARTMIDCRGNDLRCSSASAPAASTGIHGQIIGHTSTDARTARALVKTNMASGHWTYTKLDPKPETQNYPEEKTKKRCPTDRHGTKRL